MTTVATTVIRHPKERISKCSLRFLHDRPEMTFLRGKPDLRFDATGFILLAVDAPPLSLADQGHPLLLLDSTWRWLPQLNVCVTGEPIKRSIPGDLHTAYPRVSKTFEDPAGGLASIEALYVARKLLGDDDPELLHGYHWTDEFLAIVKNAGL
ncbi:MAG: pre-rRNA-processing protein TSR3 [Planctomycetota bacterium]